MLRQDFILLFAFSMAVLPSPIPLRAARRIGGANGGL
ncbi:hypothetical protein BRADI_4g42542v3 [Brachypodium distachyon]|uniref:Uncharacterized protein n=1 Tax=Brachypodium distachyon TaxID=15368 RepID=A0A2K2CTT6_BRADI|nr:hypothetical protein BRADI_4g42542v3 [Brachypodium distachyon]